MSSQVVTAALTVMLVCSYSSWMPHGGVPDVMQNRIGSRIDFRASNWSINISNVSLIIKNIRFRAETLFTGSKGIGALC